MSSSAEIQTRLLSTNQLYPNASAGELILAVQDDMHNPEDAGEVVDELKELTDNGTIKLKS